jgi:hypothetical protein
MGIEARALALVGFDEEGQGETADDPGAGDAA